MLDLGTTVDIQRLLRYTLSITLIVVFLLHIIGKFQIPTLTSMENHAYDARLKLTLPSFVDKKVVIIDIDEKSIDEIGHWPWNRDVVAEIIDKLFDHYKITTVGFDIVFAEADVDRTATLLKNMAEGPLRDNAAFLKVYQDSLASLQHDKIFARSLKNRKTTLGYILKPDITSSKGQLPESVAEPDEMIRNRIPFEKPEGYTANLKILQQSAFNGGFFDNPLLDDDGVFRRVPLLQEYNGKLYESLALALARIKLDSPDIKLQIEVSPKDSKELFLEGIIMGETSIPVDGQAGVLVPYIGKQRSFEYISAVDVLNKTVDPGKLKDKIALFGTSAPGLFDLRTTPLENIYPGVEIHANIIQGILDQRIMHKPGYTMGYEFVLILVLGLLLTFLLPALSALWSTITTVSLILLLIVTNFYIWIFSQLVFPIATPVLLVVLLFTLQMTYGFFVESRGKRQLAHLFGQYVPPELVDEMSHKMNSINLDGEIREMTVLFSDVRGFTTISESMEPKELTELINGFLTPITEVIHNQRGTIDKYMGDAVMAFWGAPLEDPQHALHALLAAREMIERMKSLRQEFAARGWPEINIGVGINSGEMNVGNKGSEFRVDYTVLGDAVNLGSRLEGLTKIYGVDIITSEATRHAVPEFEYRELDRVRVKGKDKPVTIYEPLDLLENVDKSIRKNLKHFQQGLALYRSHKWDAAEREIFALSQAEPQHKIYQIYLDRIVRYRNEPPPPDWDGAFNYTSK